jgi:hypothetical protein
MIVTGKKIQEVEIEINPLTVILDMVDQSKVLSGMNINTHISNAGYWVRKEQVTRDDYEYVNIRLATPAEIELKNAFKVVAEFAKELS